MSTADETDTPMVRRALRALATPPDQRTPGQVRLLISQQVEYERLVPVALELLAEDPLLETDFFPGDLLIAVCRLPAEYWPAHPDHATEVSRLIDSAATNPVGLPSDRHSQAAIAIFRQAAENNQPSRPSKHRSRSAR